MRKEIRNTVTIRYFYLILGILSMIFAGVIYAWSIIKTPFSEEFGWTGSELALNFTFTMVFFCIGGFVGGKLASKAGTSATIIIGGILTGLGFILTSSLKGNTVLTLYLTYGVMAGFGIGIAYVVSISAISAWFPDKKGLCSGCLMMGFGASSLILGNLAAFLIKDIGWQKTYFIIGVASMVVIVFEGCVLRRPSPEVVLPEPSLKKAAEYRQDFTTGEMLKRSSFWRGFIVIVFMASLGNTVISFARDMMLSLGTQPGTATAMVGVLSIFNGLGRIGTGVMFDHFGRRKSMLASNAITIVAASTLWTAVFIGSVPLSIVGACMAGLSYGSCPTFTSVFTADFYGAKNFSSNFSVMNFNLIFASFMATVSSILLNYFGSYTAPFVLLTALALAALMINLTIKRP